MGSLCLKQLGAQIALLSFEFTSLAELTWTCQRIPCPKLGNSLTVFSGACEPEEDVGGKLGRGGPLSLVPVPMSFRVERVVGGTYGIERGSVSCLSVSAIASIYIYGISYP